VNPSPAAIEIRPARRADLPALGRLGAALAQAHHALDHQRFMHIESPEEGYAWWLGKESQNPKAVVLVAARGRRVLGYAYGRIEPRDWNMFRERCAVGEDLMVDPAARGMGLARRLTEELMRRLAAKGAPRMVIFVAARNTGARAVFERFGFRETMVELTRELDALPPPEAAPAKPRKRASPRGRVGRAGASRRGRGQPRRSAGSKPAT
jgi:ribosomal protein S18 acetylase RimI-like enzyme